MAASTAGEVGSFAAGAPPPHAPHASTVSAASATNGPRRARGENERDTADLDTRGVRMTIAGVLAQSQADAKRLRPSPT
jgi:hypothetical protein